MARDKFDGVIETVHYKPNGEVDWVRGYERRGSTFSDQLIIDRKTLVERLKAGRRYVAGQRQKLMGSTFEISSPLRLVEKGGTSLLVVGDGAADKDHLQGVPPI